MFPTLSGVGNLFQKTFYLGVDTIQKPYYLMHMNKTTQGNEAMKKQLTLAPDWHPLSAIDNFILACGWTHETEGFKAPDSWRKALSVHFGLGIHFSREVASKLCIQYHEKAGFDF